MILKNLEIADFCYPFKMAIVYFLHKVYLDQDKYINDALIWPILRHIQRDLLLFRNVVTAS